MYAIRSYYVLVVDAVQVGGFTEGIARLDFADALASAGNFDRPLDQQAEALILVAFPHDRRVGLGHPPRITSYNVCYTKLLRSNEHP